MAGKKSRIVFLFLALPVVFVFDASAATQANFRRLERFSVGCYRLIKK